MVHGVSVAFEWQPQDGEDPNWTHALFTSTKDPIEKGGGRALPLAGVLKVFHSEFGPGTKIYRATSSAPSDIEALASARAMYLINKSAAEYSVSAEGKTVRVPAYGAVLVPADHRISGK